LRRRSTWTTEAAWATRATHAGTTGAETRTCGSARTASVAAGFRDLFNALGDGLPFSIILDVELVAQTFQHALAHLLRIEVALPRAVLRRPIPRRAILRLSVASADYQPGGCSQRAGYD